MLQHAATMGRAKAQYYLGRMYEEGDGVQKNEAEAAKWLQKAVRRRYLPAYDELGRLYRMGTGVQKNPTEAVKLFRAGAEQSDAEAQASLGNCIEFGDGVYRMEQEAEKWYRRSAEQGCVRGQCFLGELLARQAAEVFRARTRVELMFGLPISKKMESELFIEADKWQLLAARRGFVPLHQRDHPMHNTNSWITLSKEEQNNLAEALRRADAFVPRREQLAETTRNSEPAGALDGPVSSGSGFFISEDGYLVTNFHVVDDAMNIVVQRGRETYPATLVQVDQINDLALLKIAGRFRALPIGSSCASKLGDSVFTIGFPNPNLQGTEPKFTDGRISSLAGFQDDARTFQISVAVQPGNSGGALVNSEGNVVGIVAARLSDRAAFEASGALPQNVNYAIKSSYVLSLLESVPEISGKLVKPLTAKERNYEDVVTGSALPLPALVGDGSRDERAARLLFERARAKRPDLLARRVEVLKARGGRGKRADVIDKIHRAAVLLLHGESVDMAAASAGFKATGKGRHTVRAGNILMRAVRRLGFRVQFDLRQREPKERHSGGVFVRMSADTVRALDGKPSECLPLQDGRGARRRVPKIRRLRRARERKARLAAQRSARATRAALADKRAAGKRTAKARARARADKAAGCFAFGPIGLDWQSTMHGLYGVWWQWWQD